MLINKIGFEHLLNGVNCQDYAFDKEGRKCVVDGCSEGLHSEVGAKLFIHLFRQGLEVDAVFERLLNLFPTHEQIKNYLLFTILYIEETEDEFVVFECGDGYIIKLRHNDAVEFQEIDYEGVSPYFAYNYMDKGKLLLYKEGVRFNRYRFSKKEYKAVGVGTDGIGYILKSQYVKDFEKCIRLRKAVLLKRLININHNYQYAVRILPRNLLQQYIPQGYVPSANNFKDDITLVI
ncbi:MAG: hypothetical protein N2645_13685 [Clostridia bacterium]|nr:hypothetical protein [Clostridia bacterium]